MHAESINRAPAWKPGMDRIEGMAAHPSMQRKTDVELRERLADVTQKLESARVEFRDHPDRGEVEGLVRSYQETGAAVELALEWRRDAWG